MALNPSESLARATKKKKEEEEAKKKGYESSFKASNFTLDRGKAKVVESGASVSRSSVQQENLGAMQMAQGAGQIAKATKAMRSTKQISEAQKATGGMSGADQTAMAAKGAEILGGQMGGTGGGALAGAGAMMGTAASFGLVDPTSQAVAGAIGGVMGGLGAKSEAKAAQRAAKAKAEAEHARNLGNIEKEKGAKIQSALQNMSAAFSKNLQGNNKDKVRL